MARRFDTTYRMKDGSTRLGESFFNAVFQDLDLRLHTQEQIEKDWLAAVEVLNRYGLQRINEYLSPAIVRVQNIIELGFLECTSATPLLFEAGIKTVIVDEGNKRDLFVPSPFIAVTREANTTDYVVGRVQSWDKTTGALSFLIDEVHGTAGQYSDLVIHALPGGIASVRGYIQQVEQIRAAAVSEVTAITTQGLSDLADIKNGATADVQAIKLAAVNETTAIKNEAEAARDAAAGAVIAAQNAELLAEQARDAAVAAEQLTNAAALVIENGPVSSVNGQLGSVVLAPADIGAQAALVSGVNLKTINGNDLLAGGNLQIVQNIAYDSRGDLRSIAGTDGRLVIVDGIGSFLWYATTTEPDDDESCFRNGAGGWLLKTAHWDLVDAWTAQEFDANASDIEDLSLSAMGTCALTNLTASNRSSFTITVPGASVGDRVVAAPQYQLPYNIAFYATVMSANIVTIYLNNPSAAASGTLVGTWYVTVIKSV